MERRISQQVSGYRTKDGAGVSLVRVLGNQTVDVYDPILMLDSFDSTNPDDYIAGFPMHPHRGIETISYVYRGYMTHKDSLGNEDTIGDGEVQWMTAGSGIMHEEKLPAAERLLGVQLWLNLPAKDKMAPPAYHSIKNSDIQEIDFPWGKLRLLAGEFEGRKGYMSKYLPLNYYDLQINPEEAVMMNTECERSVMVFTLLGDAYISGELVKEKTAVKLTSGDKVEIMATDKKAQVLFISSIRLDEPVAWGGPIVMNSKEELIKAFDELKNGTFIQDNISYLR
ncbi:pirin family protein [Lachnospiraceae bacterium MD1]|jgi:redox-sensitive bicupin YhaK (pirin superfamily)|uniref:Pirin family protein n=1 Tax=Variimorphobacter saccharofermentans TaxID=2755051 RepID=A0A839K2S6_9FIRM|nr:pirin family protein [Variimorphobacter saccharofermentans]MBB2183299.1 pirin family protein [Variimorphobacter saccharofermentans]